MNLDLTVLLAALAIGLLGIDAGISVSALITDYRIADLSASQYAAMHQMRDKTFRRVMPVLRLTTLGLLMVCAVLVANSMVSQSMMLAAVVLMIAEISLTMSQLVPLNERVQSWTEATIPPDWAAVRDQWAARHRVRLCLGLAAYASFLVAVLSSMAP